MRNIPRGGYGKFMVEALGAFSNTRASCVVPFHPANAKVKHMS